MNSIDFIEWFKFSFFDKLLNCEILSIFLLTSDPNTEHCFLFKKLKTFFKISGQVAFTS